MNRNADKNLANGNLPLRLVSAQELHTAIERAVSKSVSPEHASQKTTKVKVESQKRIVSRMALKQGFRTAKSYRAEKLCQMALLPSCVEFWHFSQKCKGALTTVQGSAKYALWKSVWKALKNLELNLPHAI